MQIAKALVIFFVVFNLVPIALVADRKVLGRFQHRYGPNRVGPFGAMQPIADIGKLIFKEQFRPRTATGWLFALAPVISMVTAAATIAIIPFGNVYSIFGTPTGLYGVDPSIGILYAFAFGGIAFYGLMLGGWSSGSKYSFLGSMRAAAQLISYEVAQGLSIVGVVMMVGSLSLTDIVNWQGRHIAMFIPQIVGFLIFMVAGFAETNRAPFDLAEADAELIGGYNTEYGGGRFAAFFAAEYLNVVVVSAIAVTIFFGGWNLPFGIDPPHWVDPIVVIVKILIGVFFFIWVRATLPRLRYDQLMAFGWKILLPLATLNALVTAILVVVFDSGPSGDRHALGRRSGARHRPRSGAPSLRPPRTSTCIPPEHASGHETASPRLSEVLRAPRPGAAGTYRAFAATLRGLKMTFGRLVEGPMTINYPEEKTPVYPRFRGRHKLHRFEDSGLEKCVGCSLCAAACPADCIRVVAAENTPENRVSAGERYAAVYEINLSRCIFCGYCEIACPFDAITMGHDYEMADYNRSDLIFTKEMLLAEPLERTPLRTADE